MESLGKSKVKRKRKKQELDEEENSVDIKRIKTEFDEEALEAYHEEHTSSKGKKHKNKKKNKRHKVKKTSKNTDNQQVVEKSEQNDIDADNEDSGCGQPPSRHLKTRERFLDSLKTDVSRLEVSSEGEEDQYEDLHRESCRQQLKSRCMYVYIYMLYVKGHVDVYNVLVARLCFVVYIIRFISKAWTMECSRDGKFKEKSPAI